MSTGDTAMQITIVEVNGKHYANLGSGANAKKLSKHLIICAGGLRYAHEGQIIYQTTAPHNDLVGFYQRLVDRYSYILEN